jgi:hypothetical protein
MKRMKQTKRMTHKDKRIHNLLWNMMERPICQYLFSNTAGRENGYSKAIHHIEISTIYVASQELCLVDRVEHSSARNEKMRKVHDATQTLTAYMEKEIGFPKDRESYNLDRMAYKFFERFIELADEEWKKIHSKKD